LRRTGPYQVQAGIAAAHDVAATAEATDWRAIVRLYEGHQAIAPSPVVTLNHAVAVGFADGPLAGLAMLEPLLASGDLDRYQPFWAALAELRAQAGDLAGARVGYERAIALSANDVEHEELRRRLALLA